MDEQSKVLSYFDGDIFMENLARLKNKTKSQFNLDLPRGELQFITANERENYIEHAKTGVLGQGFGLASHLKAVKNILVNTYKDIPLLPHL
jgi:hypothetical protein